MNHRNEILESVAFRGERLEIIDAGKFRKSPVSQHPVKRGHCRRYFSCWIGRLSGGLLRAAASLQPTPACERELNIFLRHAVVVGPARDVRIGVGLGVWASVAALIPSPTAKIALLAAPLLFVFLVELRAPRPLDTRFLCVHYCFLLCR